MTDTISNGSDLMEPKFLYDWRLEVGKDDVVRIKWCDETGIHGGDLPKWLLQRIIEKVRL